MPEEKTVTFASGAISTKIPRYELIPRAGLAALARRFERGIRVKGEGSWNALNNIEAAEDSAFVIDRLAHCIEHCYKAIGRLTGTEPPLGEQDTADGGDAGAILFAGCLLAVHLCPRRRHDDVDASGTADDKIPVDVVAAIDKMISPMAALQVMEKRLIEWADEDCPRPDYIRQAANLTEVPDEIDTWPL